jgi:hypothetical protein
MSHADLPIEGRRLLQNHHARHYLQEEASVCLPWQTLSTLNAIRHCTRYEFPHLHQTGEMTLIDLHGHQKPFYTFGCAALPRSRRH